MTLVHGCQVSSRRAMLHVLLMPLVPPAPFATPRTAPHCSLLHPLEVLHGYTVAAPASADGCNPTPSLCMGGDSCRAFGPTHSSLLSAGGAGRVPGSGGRQAPRHVGSVSPEDHAPRQPPHLVRSSHRGH